MSARIKLYVHQKGNGNWVCRITFPEGVTHHGRKTYHETCDTKQQARKLGEALKDKFTTLLAQQGHLSPANTLTIEDILNKYLLERVPGLRSAKSETSRVNTLIRLIGHMPLDRIKIKDLEDFKALRMGKMDLGNKKDGIELETTNYLRKVAITSKPASSQSVRHELSVLKRAFKHHQYSEELSLHNHPIEKVKLPPSSIMKTRRVTDEQLELIAKHSDSTIAPLAFRFLLETAMRVGELTKLRWKDCDITTDRPTVTLLDTKAPREDKRSSRTIPLTPLAQKILQQLFLARNGDYVFPIRGDSLTKAFGRAKERAGLDAIRLHDLRHEATTRFFENHGLNEMQVAALTGHKDMKTLARYTHIDAGKTIQFTSNNSEGSSVIFEGQSHPTECGTQKVPHGSRLRRDKSRSGVVSEAQA